MGNITRIEQLKNKAKLIELKPVQSSNIGAIGYDENNNLLKVIFKNKDKFSTYLYENVELETYKRISEAQSVGKEISAIIKNKEKYNYTKIQ